MPLKLFTQGENCDCPSGFTEIFIVGGLNGALASDVFNTYNHHVNNHCINLTGVLILDTWMNFTNCRFYMNSGAQIIVKNYSLLGSYSTSYKSCTNQMWQGILFEDYGWTIFRNSSIQDALFALHTNENSLQTSMIVQKSIFRNNFIGIYNPRESGGLDIKSVFVGNRFLGSEPLKTPPPSSNEVPFYENGSYAYAGIVTYEDPLFIGRPNASISERNYFENLYCGISGFDNVMSIQASFFKDIPGLAHANQFNSVNITYGIAGNTGVSEIYTNSGSVSLPLLSVTGFGKTDADPVSFSNVQLAVFCYGADCFVSQNRMVSVLNGISCIDVKARRQPGGIVIQNNKITHKSTGISISNCSSSNISVHDNNMYGTPDANVFSSQVYFINNTSSDIHVRDNYFYPTKQVNGTYFAFSSAIEVSNNHLHWQSHGTNGRTSYYFDNSPSIISCNDASNQGYENTQTNAFRLNNSENSMLDCNIANYHYRGFWVLANNMDADLLTNSVSNCTYGWHYASTGISGAQENKGNTYSQNFNVGAQHNGSDGYILRSLYKVRPLGNNDHPYGSQYNIYTPNALEKWYGTDSTITPPICTMNCGTNMFADPHNNDDIINWPDGPDWFNEESRWNSKAYLVRRILEEPALLSGYPELDTFLTQSADSSYLKLATIEFSIDHLFDPDSNQQMTLEQFSQFRLNVLAQIDSIHVLIDDEDSTSLLILLQSRDSLVEVLDSAGLILNAVIHDIHLDALQNADSILTINNELNFNRTYEANALVLNRIVLRNLIEQADYSSEEKDSLQAIADQCAYSGGVAVYRARAIMNPFSFQDQDDELICFPPIPILNKLHITTKANVFYVVPNPADQSVTLHAAENLKVIEVALINEQGKVLMKFSGKTIPHSIDIKGIQNGLYYLRFLTENDQYFVKFMKL